MSIDVQAFCLKRDIPHQDIKIRQIVDWNVKEYDQIALGVEITLPPDFPDKYVNAVRKTAEACLVSRVADGYKNDVRTVSVAKES